MWEFINKNIVTIVSFFFAMLSLLFSINSDIFVQDDTFFLWVPYKSLGTRYDNSALENITRHADRQRKQLTYIFVLDKSQSLEYTGKVPDWYERKNLKRLNAIVSDTNHKFNYSAGPDAFELCKVKLALLLEAIPKKDNVKFEIWIVGDEATDAYPRKIKKYKGTVMELREALEKLMEIGPNIDLNTDFSLLFDGICAKHRALLKSKPLNKYKMPSFVLIILSDFIHDIGPKTQDDKTLKDNREKSKFLKDSEDSLVKKIEEVAESNSIANMILVKREYSGDLARTAAKGKYQFYFGDILENKFVPSRVDNSLLSGKLDDTLYANIFTDTAIKLYYRNPVYINSSTTVRINRRGVYRIGLIWENIRLPEPIFTMEYVLQDIQGQTLINDGENDVQGVLYLNGPQKTTPTLGINNKIKLSYSGSLPQNGNSPHFKIFYPKGEKLAFTIPIQFVKMLPVGIAYLMFVLEILLAVSILILFWLRVVKQKINFNRVYEYWVNRSS